MDAWNAVLDHIRTGRLDEAEAAARKLVGQYPDTHDGYDRLGHVYEARGENKLAADCCRRVIAILSLAARVVESGRRLGLKFSARCPAFSRFDALYDRLCPS